MSENPEKPNAATDYLRPVSLPFIASECVGMPFNDILRLYAKYNIIKPEKKRKRDVMVEIRFSEATLICRIQNDVCTEAYFCTDDTEEETNN